MAYTNVIHETGFTLYCQDMSVPEVHENLKRGQPGCERLSLHTVENWATRFSWRKRRKDIQARAQHKADEARGDFLGEVLADLTAARANLRDYIRQGDGKKATAATPQNLEGAVGAYIKIARFERSLRGLDRVKGPIQIGRIQVIAIVDKVLERMGASPHFAPLIARHGAELAQLVAGDVLSATQTPPPAAVASEATP